jgi:hypothetical protein
MLKWISFKCDDFDDNNVIKQHLEVPKCHFKNSIGKKVHIWIAFDYDLNDEKQGKLEVLSGEKAC